MPLFRFGDNWGAFRDLEREMDRFLQGMNMTLQGFRSGRQFPAVNLYEFEDEYVLTAELPGTKVEDLDLSLIQGRLTIKGQRSDLDGVEDDRYRRHERFSGQWQRTISIPDRIQEDNMTAEFNNGILKVHLPKGDYLKPRQIPVLESNNE